MCCGFSGQLLSPHVLQLQVAFEHTCGLAAKRGFVVFPLILTAPLTFTAAFGCKAHNKHSQNELNTNACSSAVPAALLYGRYLRPARGSAVHAVILQVESGFVLLLHAGQEAAVGIHQLALR